tara:strand:+ start:5124 stop:5585 length:462 start_codon:yes stop_codon:yes gene_type:complete
MTKKDKIIVASIVGGLSIAYLIYRSVKKNSLYEEILDKIGVGSNFQDSSVWNPIFLIQIDNEGREVQKLNNSQLNRYVEILEEAIDGLGTDESAIRSVFEQIPSKYEVAQVNKYYGNKYNQSLKQALIGDLNNKEMSKINNIILSKPRVIYIG